MPLYAPSSPRSSTTAATAGAVYSDQSTLTVSLPGASSAQITNGRYQIDYTGAFNVTSWLEAMLQVINVDGAGIVSKAVGNRVQINFGATSGGIAAAVCYEATVGAILNASLAGGNTVGFLFPDLSGTTNIGRVDGSSANGSVLTSFAGMHKRSRSLNVGMTHKALNSSGSIYQEVGPHHPGHASSLYYGPDNIYQPVSTAGLTAGVIYYAPISIGERTTFTKIGVKVTTLSTGTARLGIYYMQNGQPTTLLLDAGTVDVTSAADKEITISQEIEAGDYALTIQAQATPVINFYPSAGISRCGSLTSTLTDATIVAGPTTYGPLASTASGVTRSGALTGAVPGLWLRK